MFLKILYGVSLKSYALKTNLQKKFFRINRLNNL